MVDPKSTDTSVLDGATEVLLPREMPVSNDRDVQIGSELGDYLIDKCIGSGGGGVVYSAKHRERGLRVAIKVLRPEMVTFPTMVARFAREIEAVNRIKHPNIVEIYECGELKPGHPYYVMELLEGTDLRTLIGQHGRFTARECLEFIEPVCLAAQAAHDVGIIHRDIKANNVIITEMSGRRSIKLLDFGIAKMVQDEGSGQGLTEPGARLGTAHNMAPEQIRCERVDGRADVYALGVLLFQLLTGHYPFHADDPRQIALLHLQAPVPRPSASAPVTAAVDAVVMRCLEKQRDRRFGSAAELLEAFRKAVGESKEEPRDIPTQALGVYFEIGTNTEDELDDDAFEDMANVLDLLEEGLTSRNFSLPLRTSNALLGVRPFAGDADLEIERTEAESMVAELQASLAARPNAHPSVQVSASLTIGDALCRKSITGIEIVGGPLLEVGSWTEHTRQAG